MSSLKFNQSKSCKELVSPVFILLINLLLAYPLFFGEYTQHMGSIESAFIADAIFIDRNGFANWNPLWYCGFPFHLTYTPLVPYLSVIIHWLVQPISLPQAYRLLTALAFVFGPVTLFFFVKYLTKREITAFTTAFIYSVVLMPLYSTIPFLRELIPVSLEQHTHFIRFIPYNLTALIFFGEGPHIFGLTLIPLACVALLRLFKKPNIKQYLLTSLAIASVALVNLIAIYALALMIIVICLFEALQGAISKKIQILMICGAISYGLIAFHYDLSFLKASISFGVFGGNYVFTGWNLGLMGLVFTTVLVSLFFYFKRVSRPTHLFIGYAWFALFFLIALMWYLFEIPFAPQPGRYIPELNMSVAILLGIAITPILDTFAKVFKARRTHEWKYFITILVGIAILTLPLATLTWEVTASNQEIENTPEYNIAMWFENNASDQRVFATGTICFWLNVFSEVAQLRGGSDQGSTNPWWMDVATELNGGDDGKLGALLCDVLNIRYIVVIYPDADTPYHDSLFPDKFDGILPLRYLYKEFGIFEVPLTNPELIQSFDINRLPDMRVKTRQDLGDLLRYVDSIKNPPNVICSYKFDGVDRAIITVINATENTGILIKMTFDNRWKAYVDGGEVEISEIGPSFMFINPRKEGSYKLELVCGQSTSEVIGRVISIITLALFAIIGGYKSYKTKKKSPYSQ